MSKCAAPLSASYRWTTLPPPPTDLMKRPLGPAPTGSDVLALAANSKFHQTDDGIALLVQ